MAKLNCLLLNNSVPLEFTAVVSDSHVESLTYQVQKPLLRFWLEAVPVVVTCEVEIWQIQHSRLKRVHNRHISDPTERLLNIICRQLFGPMVRELLKGLGISTLVRVFLDYFACDWSVVAWSVVADVVRVGANVISPCFVFHFS
jgi:hypothetical protein